METMMKVAITVIRSNIMQEGGSRIAKCYESHGYIHAEILTFSTGVNVGFGVCSVTKMWNFATLRGR